MLTFSRDPHVVPSQFQWFSFQLILICGTFQDYCTWKSMFTCCVACDGFR